MKAIRLNTDNFDEVTSNGVAVVDFGAPWCGPCRDLWPKMDKLAIEFAGRVVAGRVNSDEFPALANRFNVTGIPHIVILRDGIEQKRIVGNVPYEIVRDAVTKALSAALVVSAPEVDPGETGAVEDFGELEESPTSPEQPDSAKRVTLLDKICLFVRRLFGSV